MTAFDALSPEERAEVHAAIHDAYMREDGTIRPHVEADEIFDGFVADAVQAHRTWAGLLLDEWRDNGRRAFLRDQWRNEEIFNFIHKGRKRRRTERRGTRVRHPDGHTVWIQESLFSWTVDQLHAAIRECGARIEEERANIAMYRALIELIEETGQHTVRTALEVRGMSLEDYLSERGAA